ncbi:MAG: abortive infection family protein [Eubacteriaceae bacterium]|nr:abortive infection family protein [Eubacteriaceae bacterium]
MAKLPNPFNILRSKEILAILDGDTKFQEIELDDLTSLIMAMPYQSGPDLCGLSALFGLPITYAWGGTNLSRWQYLDNLIEYCIKNDKCSDLLSYMFSKEQFSKILSGHAADIIDSTYKRIVTEVIQQINGLLYFGGNEFTMIGNQFVVKKIGVKVEVAIPKIKMIDRDYIKNISARAMQDVEQGNYDSAITKSRTLLEEIFWYVIEKKNEAPLDSGDIGKLYKQVRTLYNMHTDAGIDRRINTLLSGLSSIVSAIAEMRNKDSDAHGVGGNRIAIEEYHTRLFVNSAMTMADFILSVASKNQVSKNNRTI